MPALIKIRTQEHYNDLKARLQTGIPPTFQIRPEINSFKMPIKRMPILHGIIFIIRIVSIC